MNHNVINTPSKTAIHCFGERETSTLVVHEGASVLVECHDAEVFDVIAQQGLPTPSVTLHTHVQPQHCRESEARWSGGSWVPEGLEVVASDFAEFAQACKTTWDKPEQWMQTMGRERFGIAGARTYATPRQPLTLAGALRAGEEHHWLGLVWRVIALPGHMQEAVGLVLVDADQTLACFIGDLMRHPGLLVNLHDLEHTYAATRLPNMPGLLRETADSVKTDLYLPATGPAIFEGGRAARRLADRIDHAVFVMAEPSPPPPPPASRPDAHRLVGRFEQVAHGVFQFARPGNAIVFIDEQGRGLMFDPGPCDYENPSRDANFLADLIALENEAHLQSIDQVLITHIHGDHYDMLSLVQERYPGCRVGSWEPVAQVIEQPESFSYAALLPWYGSAQTSYAIDDRLIRSEPFNWHNIRVDTVHLPGHCLHHAGYRLEFSGKRWVVTGDTICSDGQAMGLSYVMCNHGTPTGEAGVMTAFETMLNQPAVDINLCGHGSRFDHCSDMYRASLNLMQRQAEAMAEVVYGHDLEQAATRPWYPSATLLQAY